MSTRQGKSSGEISDDRLVQLSNTGCVADKPFLINDLARAA